VIVGGYDDGEMQVAETTVLTYSDASFSRLRKKFRVSENFLKDNVDFNAKRDMGGKGGSKHVYSFDSKYILKTVTPADQATLLNISRDYADHVLNGKSMLARILLHFHYNGQDWIAMNNWLPKENMTQFDDVYDIKGCDDDKKLVSTHEKVPIRRKRWYYMPYRWPFYSKATLDERYEYKQGKAEARRLHLPVSRRQKNLLMRVLTRDVEFLERHRLMDYSLVVGVKRNGKAIPIFSNPHTKFGNRGLKVEVGSTHNEEKKTYHIGIIDFLQVWNLKKRVAKMIKFREPNKSTMPPGFYAQRFLNKTNQLFQDDRDRRRERAAAAAEAAAAAAAAADGYR